ncbi:MAG: endolytic transglycosylase MltG, partial [Sedimenticola sp.]|nr:endolytic transglycosylase MltG [Sedimenticola sp.]
MLHRLLGILILGGSFAVAWFMMSLNSFSTTPLALPEEGVTYHLVPGSSLSSMARDLERDGYLESALYLRIKARLEGQAGKIKAGEYYLEPGLTPESLLALLVSGQVTSYSLTLVEGWDFRQVLAAVRGHEALAQTLEGLEPSQIMARLGHPDLHPEGQFLPDTYHFPRGTRDIDF